MHVLSSASPRSLIALRCSRVDENGLAPVMACLRRPSTSGKWRRCGKMESLAIRRLIAPACGSADRLSLDRHVGKHIESKSDALDTAEGVRAAIRAGTFGNPAKEAGNPVPPWEHQQTVDQLAREFVSEYSKGYVPGRRRTGPRGAKASWQDDQSMLRVLCEHRHDDHRWAI